VLEPLFVLLCKELRYLSYDKWTKNNNTTEAQWFRAHG
jgi:hypothetical protein